MGKGRRYDDTPKLNIKKVIATIIAMTIGTINNGPTPNSGKWLLSSMTYNMWKKNINIFRYT